MLPIQEKLLTGYNRPQRKLKKLRGIVVHWTSNTDKGANALMHYSYFNRPKPKTDVTYGSAHYTVDDSSIYRFIPDNEEAYHVGAKAYKSLIYTRLGVPYGDSPNYYTIGIEMCVNSDGDFDKTRQNTIDLLRYLCKTYNMERKDVYRHFDITGKDCPQMMLDNKVWEDFLDQVFPDTTHTTQRYEVTASVLNVRKGAGAGYPVVAQLHDGDAVTRINTAGDWFQIGEERWIHSGYVVKAP